MFSTSTDRKTAHRLTERTGHVFHGIIDGAGVGTRYGLRVHGPWDPENGLRHNAHKLLLDPHATAIEGQYDWGQTVFGHDQLQPDRMDESDSAPSTPRSVIADPQFDWTGDVPPRIPLADTVIYETHVKGFTAASPRTCRRRSAEPTPVSAIRRPSSTSPISG